MDDVMTIEEVTKTFSSDLPDWQQESNLVWLRRVHELLKEGGVWTSPTLGVIYSRKGDGFILEAALIAIPRNRTEH